MTVTIHSNKIDDILTGVTPKTPDFAKEQAPAEETAPEKPDEILSQNDDSVQENKTEPVESHEKVAEKPVEAQKETKSESHDHDLDDYGNPIDKPRVYTEEEVQRIVKDRLSRGNVSRTEQQQVQKAAENFKADPNSNEDWEVQLKSFIKNTLNEVQTERSTLEWQEQERRKQDEFETKFTSGMNRYKDFTDVVGKMPITNSIMMAAREMTDPAAFLYAASKLHPDELKNIANMKDPFTQARELGRLDERMKKARAISNAPAPLSKTKSDMSPKYTPKQSIDDKIIQHAKNRKR